MRTGLWPFRSAPFADELLTSWIARLAHGHGLRPTIFLSVIQPGRPDFTALDWAPDTELLGLLAAHTDIPLSAIESLRLRFNPDPDLRDLLHHNWQGPALQYCAGCLTGTVPYYRRSWRLASTRLCPLHRIALDDSCQRCSNSVRFHELMPSKYGLGVCHKCGDRLAGRPSEVRPVSGALEKLIEMEQRMERILA